MKLFYGTGNQSKLRNMRAILAGMPIELITPADLGIRLPAVEETGATPLENAVLKAETYHAVSGLPSFSLDSGLYLEGVPAELQPGPYVRRVKGRELSDEEFIAYYQQLAHQYGGRLKARFINGLCVVLNDQQRKEAAGPQVSTDWFWIVETPHPTRLKGFPMDSIAVDPQTGRYWVEGDLKDEQNAKGSTLATGVRRFFSELLQNDLRSEIEQINYGTYDLTLDSAGGGETAVLDKGEVHYAYVNAARAAVLFTKSDYSKYTT